MANPTKHKAAGSATFNGIYPLPNRPHVPGRNARPSADNPACRAAEAAPTRTDAGNWDANTCYLFGFDLYDAGFFWEAHEVWEPVWMGCSPNSPDRHLLQGLIQTTNACLKILMQRRHAVERLTAMAGTCFANAQVNGESVMGLVPSEAVVLLKKFQVGVTALPPGAELENTLRMRPRFRLALQIM